MNLQFYEEKLHSSDFFKKFREENPQAYLCSILIIIDKKGKDSKVHFDYFVPKERKIVSFQLESEIKIISLETFNEKIPEKILLDYDLNFDDTEKIIMKKMEAENVKNEVQKMIMSLQKLDGKDFLIVTVFISMLGIIKIIMDPNNREIKEFEKKSFFDIMNILKKK